MLRSCEEEIMMHRELMEVWTKQQKLQSKYIRQNKLEKKESETVLHLDSSVFIQPVHQASLVFLLSLSFRGKFQGLPPKIECIGSTTTK